MKAPALANDVKLKLEKAAYRAAKAAYAPYFSGCNVENASYGLCTCAERTAIVAAVMAGEREVEAVVVYTPTEAPTSPCGACRQVINEFGPDALVICVCDSDTRIEAKLSTLLPNSFGPSDLFQRSPAKKRT
jgi:cytidine deaminase